MFARSTDGARESVSEEEHRRARIALTERQKNKTRPAARTAVTRFRLVQQFTYAAPIRSPPARGV